MKLTWQSPTGEKIAISIYKNSDESDVSHLSFLGISCLSISSENAADNFILYSFYAVADPDKKISRDSQYVAQKKGSNYTYTVEANKHYIAHITGNGRSIFANVSANYSNKPISENEKSILYRTLLHFMQTHSQDISFESPKDRDELIQLFGNKFFTPTETTETQQKTEVVKNIINNHLEVYQKQGKKFGLFDKHADRQDTLTKLLQTIKPIIDKKILSTTDYKKLAEQLVIAKNNTIASHKKHSTFGSWGITSSRLAESLKQSLNELVSKGFLSKETLETIEKKNPIPKESDENKIMRL